MSSRKELKRAKKEQAKIEEKELEELFEKYSSIHRPSFQQLTVYFPAALLLTVVPTFLYFSLFELPLDVYGPIFLVVMPLSAMIITLAYHNVTYWLKARLDQERSDVISLASIKGGKKSDKEEELAARRGEQQAITTKESMAFSIVYNNALFLVATLVMGFFVFTSASAAYNYILSVSFSAALLTVTSASAL